MFIVLISKHVLSIFLKLSQKFLNFIQNFLIFPRNLSLVPLHSFTIILIPQFLQTSYRKVWNLLEISEKFFSKFYKIISKCLGNFGEIFLQFFGKISINERFFIVFSQFIYYRNFWTLSIPSQNRYQNFSKFFQNFIRFLRNFSRVCTFLRVILIFPHNFSITSSYFLFSY